MLKNLLLNILYWIHFDQRHCHGNKFICYHGNLLLIFIVVFFNNSVFFIFFINNQLHKWGLTTSPFCSFCNVHKETKKIFSNLDPQSAFYGFLESNFIQKTFYLFSNAHFIGIVKTIACAKKGLNEREMHERFYPFEIGKNIHHNTKWRIFIDEYLKGT